MGYFFQLHGFSYVEVGTQALGRVPAGPRAPLSISFHLTPASTGRRALRHLEGIDSLS